MRCAIAIAIPAGSAACGPRQSALHCRLIRPAPIAAALRRGDFEVAPYESEAASQPGGITANGFGLSGSGPGLSSRVCAATWQKPLGSSTTPSGHQVHVCWTNGSYYFGLGLIDLRVVVGWGYNPAGLFINPSRWAAMGNSRRLTVEAQTRWYFWPPPPPLVTFIGHPTPGTWFGFHPNTLWGTRREVWSVDLPQDCRGFTGTLSLTEMFPPDFAPWVYPPGVTQPPLGCYANTINNYDVEVEF